MDSLESTFVKQKNEILSRADEDAVQATPHSGMIDYLTEIMSEASILYSDPNIEYVETKSGFIYGYGFNIDNKVLDIYSGIYVDELQNIEIVKDICSIMDEVKPRKNGQSYDKLISFVPDRSGHDFRYSINTSKIKKELGWKPKESFKSGIRKTIKWYLDNINWLKGSE